MVLQQAVTADELRRLPSSPGRRALVRGRLIEMAPPGAEHGEIAVRVASRLAAFVERESRGAVRVESGYVLSRDPDTVRGPDVSFVRRERLPETPLRRGFHDGPPDLAVEIVSPGDRRRQVEDVVRDYLEAGTPCVWVVDPRSHTVEVHEPGRVTTLRTGDRLSGGTALSGFEVHVLGTSVLELVDWWGRNAH